ncbi:MAG: tetratricopeptide (TPR) repeat protein [Cyclobacteriaceae bacterium]|jgi:tetratricopeptide (TPR) repeat protein
MDSNRIKMLENYRIEDPNDPFPIYGLALEFIASNPLQSLGLFEELLEKFPSYTATYYHAADLYVDLERYEEAKRTYKQGIDILQGLGTDQKALAELQNAYQNFLVEIDD